MTLCFNKQISPTDDCGPALYQVTVLHPPEDCGPEGPITIPLCARCAAEWRLMDKQDPPRVVHQYRTLQEN